MAQDFYTISEVAGLLHFNPRTIRRWIEKGKVKAQLIGGSLRIPRKEYNRLSGTDSKLPAEVIKIAELYNADVEMVGDKYTITYKERGQGDKIAAHIEEILAGLAYRMKLIPSDCILEVEIY